MKTLVYAHQLEVGGTQVNAIDLALALREFHGFEPVIFATPGPMVSLVQQNGLRFLPAPNPGFHPSPARMSALREAVRLEKPDLIWAWDWWQCVDAYYSVHMPQRLPMVVTDMSMSLIRLLPKQLPTTFGTPEVVEQATAAGRRRVAFIPPPVDIQRNAPGVVNSDPFRKHHGIDAAHTLIVTVSRLDQFMKRESLLRTIDAVRTLGRELPIRFVIVGDGSARPELERRADATNTALRRQAITFEGQMIDPRPAYAAADIVVGMGGSALRGMAFSKAVIVVGEHGFAELFSPMTAPKFYHQGFYGRGDAGSSNEGLVKSLRFLCENRGEIETLGDFSRQFVMQHFALEVVAARLAKFCADALIEAAPLRRTLVDSVRTAAVYLRERRFLSRPPFAARVKQGASAVVPTPGTRDTVSPHCQQSTSPS
jgi:glycosyltransferase involved in cell wall biosynthesis